MPTIGVVLFLSKYLSMEDLKGHTMLFHVCCSTACTGHFELFNEENGFSTLHSHDLQALNIEFPPLLIA